MVYLYSHFKNGEELKMTVKNPQTNEIVWSAEYPAYTEDQRTGELHEDYNLINIGAMKSLMDNVGLENHLKKLGVIQPGDVVSFSHINRSVEKLEKGGLFLDVKESARFVLLKMMHEKLYRLGFNKSNPKFEAMKNGVQDAIDKGYLRVQETPEHYMLIRTDKLGKYYFANGGSIEDEDRFMGDLFHLWRTDHLSFKDGKWINTGYYKGAPNISSGRRFTNKEANSIAKQANKKELTESSIKDWTKMKRMSSFELFKERKRFSEGGEIKKKKNLIRR